MVKDKYKIQIHQIELMQEHLLVTLVSMVFQIIITTTLSNIIISSKSKVKKVKTILERE